MYFCGSVICGPWFEYKDMIDFFHAKNNYRKIHQIDTFFAASVRFFAAASCIIVVNISGKLLGGELCVLISDEFATQSLPYQLWILFLVNKRQMLNMMFGFLCTEASVIACGLAYESEKDDWSRVTQLDVVSLFKSTTVTSIVKTWNMSTQKWLTYYVYVRQLPTDRTKSRGFNMQAIALTFAVVAVWHGFYSGYMHFFGMATLYMWQAK